MLNIRDATPEDGEVLAVLDMCVFPESCFNERTLSEEVHRGGGYIAYLNSDPVGYVVFRTDGTLVDILRLGVTNKSRHNGLGGALLRLAMRKGTLSMLCVKKDNVPALHLYRKHGFEIVGCMPHHNSWVMKTSS